MHTSLSKILNPNTHRSSYQLNQESPKITLNNCAILMEWNKSLSAEQCGLTVHPDSILVFIEKILNESKTEADWEMVDHVYKSIDDLLSISEFESLQLSCLCPCLSSIQHRSNPVDLIGDSENRTTSSANLRLDGLMPHSLFYFYYYSNITLPKMYGLTLPKHEWYIFKCLTVTPARWLLGSLYYCTSSTWSYLPVLSVTRHFIPVIIPLTLFTFVYLPSSFNAFRCNLKLLMNSKQSMFFEDISSFNTRHTSKAIRDVYKKLDELLEIGEVKERDGELNLTKNLASVINSCIAICEDTQNNSVVFSSLFFNYSVVLANAIDEKVAHLAQDVINKMDKYLTRYQSDDVNVKDGSSVSLSLYFAIKNLHKILLNICEPNCQKTVFEVYPEFSGKLKLQNYSEWFHVQFQFWLQTFRNECLSRTQRAVEFDSSVIVEDVQISVSCVDAISCFTQVCVEWKKIEFDNADLRLVAVTKLTDAICDGARHYVKHLVNAAQKLYEAGIICTEPQSCLFINNMEHVRRFLPTIPEILEWEVIVDKLSQGDEEHQLKVQALKTLSRLIKCAERDIREHLDFMLSKIAAYLHSDIIVCLQKWADPINQIQDVHSLLKGLDEHLRNLHSHLKDSVFTPLLMELWKVILQKYAESLLKNLENVRDYFLELGLGEKEITNNYVYQSLSQKLRYNAKTSIDLQLDYFKELANAMSTPIDYQGHLCMKFGFQEEFPGTVTLFVYVLRAVHLPGLDHSGFSDPYVSLELLPKPFFKTPGAVLRLSVKDFDKIGTNDFAGEILLNLSQASDMSKVTSVDFLPAHMLPLKRPVETGGAFQALKDRRKWDKEAKVFIRKRMNAIQNQRERTDNKSPSRKISDLFQSLIIFNTVLVAYAEVKLDADRQEGGKAFQSLHVRGMKDELRDKSSWNLLRWLGKGEPWIATEHALSGNAYNKAMRSHKLKFQALWRLLFPKFTQYCEQHDPALRDKIEEFSSDADKNKIEKLVTELAHSTFHDTLHIVFLRRILWLPQI
ncbi:Protein unc-13 D [Nymphon striatum]|nr:Protein unc-13 D [Nymphon striatum]